MSRRQKALLFGGPATLIVLITLAIMLSKVPAGYVGVKVNLLGSDKGIDVEELGVGRYLIGINEELHLFPTFQQNYVWTQDEREGSEDDESIKFQTVEGLDVGADIGISYTVDGTKASNIFSKYRKGIDEITDIYLRNHVRDAFVAVASTMKVDSVYGEGKTKLVNQVEAVVRKELKDIGINIDKIYLVGSFRLPPTVVNAINSKIEATQRAVQRENEVQETIAEARKNEEKAKGEAIAKEAAAKGEAKAILAVANAQADANRKLSASLTRTLIEYKKIEKWNGVMPKVSSDAGVLLNLSEK